MSFEESEKQETHSFLLVSVSVDVTNGRMIFPLSHTVLHVCRGRKGTTFLSSHVLQSLIKQIRTIDNSS